MPDSQLARSEANAHGGAGMERETPAREREGDAHGAATTEHDVGGAVGGTRHPRGHTSEQIEGEGDMTSADTRSAHRVGTNGRAGVLDTQRGTCTSGARDHEQPVGGKGQSRIEYHAESSVTSSGEAVLDAKGREILHVVEVSEDSVSPLLLRGIAVAGLVGAAALLLRR